MSFGLCKLIGPAIIVVFSLVIEINLSTKLLLLLLLYIFFFVNSEIANHRVICLISLVSCSKVLLEH
ncbi:hypothetical protein AB3S75_036183 [Citrus x aurantiifolia]